MAQVLLQNTMKMVKEAEEIVLQLVDEELPEWRRRQRLACMGAPLDTSLDRLQNWSERQPPSPGRRWRRRLKVLSPAQVHLRRGDAAGAARAAAGAAAAGQEVQQRPGLGVLRSAGGNGESRRVLVPQAAQEVSRRLNTHQVW